MPAVFAFYELVRIEMERADQSATSTFAERFIKSPIECRGAELRNSALDVQRQTAEPSTPVRPHPHFNIAGLVTAFTVQNLALDTTP
jgi:hypothetical protein